MPHAVTKSGKQVSKSRRSRAKAGRRKSEPRYSVGLPSNIARDVQKFAGTVDTSMSKAITMLVRIGLESQEERKRAFFEKLRENLASDDPKRQDQLVDEFRALILGQ